MKFAENFKNKIALVLGKLLSNGCYFWERGGKGIRASELM